MSTDSALISRAIAVLAISVAVIGVIAILASGGDGDSPADSGDERANTRTTSEQQRGDGGGGQRRRRPAQYVVEPGDTLLEISDQTGVSTSRLEELNPEMDPQLLIAGQRLRLR